MKRSTDTPRPASAPRSTGGTTGLTVGFVLFVATVIFLAGLFWVGSGTQLFSGKATYSVLCPETTGLKPGSRVFVQGVPVGTVQSIEFVDDPEVQEIEVRFRIESRAAQRRVYRDAEVTIQSQGLLGDASLQVRPGTRDAGVLPAGGSLQYLQRSMVDDLVGDEFANQAEVLLDELVRILKKVERGEGALGKLLNEQDLYDHLTKMVRSLDSLTEDVEQLTSEVTTIVSDVRREKGLLGKVLFSEKYERDVATLLEHSVASLAALDRSLAQLESGEGIASRLLGDREFADRIESIASRLDRGASSAEKILALLERGDGSIGLLLHDPSIAASLRDVFLGVRDFEYVRNLIQNAERKGRVFASRQERASERARMEATRAKFLASLEEPAGEGEGRAVPSTARDSDAAPTRSAAAGDEEGSDAGGQR